MILNEVKKLWHYGPVLPEKAEAVVYTTIEALQRRAYERVRAAFVQALGVEKKYHYDPTLKAAIDQLTAVAVAGVFGEIPLTEKEKQEKLQSLHYVMDNIYSQAQALDPWPGESYAGSSMKLSAHSACPVTKDEIVAAMKKIEGGKSGLPAAQAIFTEAEAALAEAKKLSEEIKKREAEQAKLKKVKPAKSEEEALAQLWHKVEKKSDELFGVKKDAKYQELMGLDPEEI